MVVACCSRVVLVFLALSKFAKAEKKCALGFKGYDNEHPHVLAPFSMDPNHCIYKVVVPDYICSTPNGANNLGVGVNACEPDSPPIIEIYDDLIHVWVYRSDCSHDEGQIAVTVYCKNDTLGRIGRQVQTDQPMEVPAGIEQLILRKPTGVLRVKPEVPTSVH